MNKTLTNSEPNIKQQQQDGEVIETLSNQQLHELATKGTITNNNNSSNNCINMNVCNESISNNNNNDFNNNDNINNTMVEQSREMSKQHDSFEFETLPQEIIHQIVPDGIEVKKVSYGHGIYATKFFPKGSVLYIGSQLIIPNKYAEFKLILNNNGVIFLININTDTHSVQFSETERWLYLFDSFTNHSCDPTTISRQTSDERINNQYQTIAVRDIYLGDELTCDYNLFEYDCYGKIIDICLCGSSHCIGRIAGFRYLSIEEQQRCIDLVEPEVLEAMSADINNKFIYISDLHYPIVEKVVVIESVDKGSYKLITQRDFTEGEVIYTNESLIFPEDYTIVIDILGNRKWLVNHVDTVNKGNGKREFYYFDSFRNPSYDPNIYMIYHSENIYDVVANRKIAKGDELCSNYDSLDVGQDRISFKCQCGTSKCKEIFKA